MLIQSALFVPASRTDRINKALQSGAHLVIVDLEDAVAFDEKDNARQQLIQFCTDNPQAQFIIRINDAASSFFNEDLALIKTVTNNVQGIMLPKAENAQQIDALGEYTKAVYPLVETAKGVTQLEAICAAKNVQFISFGALDLALDLNLEDHSQGASEMLNHVRRQISLFSYAAGLDAPIDGVFPDFKNTEAYRKHLQYAKSIGFGGSLCIHPKQITVIHEVFQPKQKEIEWAQKIMDEVSKHGTGAFQLDGEMVDLPVIEKAKKILSSVK